MELYGTHLENLDTYLDMQYETDDLKYSMYEQVGRMDLLSRHNTILIYACRGRAG